MTMQETNLEPMEIEEEDILKSGIDYFGEEYDDMDYYRSMEVVSNRMADRIADGYVNDFLDRGRRY